MSPKIEPLSSTISITPVAAPGSESLDERQPSLSKLSVLERDKSLMVGSHFIAVPTENSESLWKDYVVALWCLISFGVATSVGFNQRWTVYWGQTGQFVRVGFSLAIMSWRTQLFL